MTTEAEMLERINELRHGYWRSSVLFAGVELGVFAALRKGALSSSALAAELGCDARGMLILCRALAGLGLLVAQGGANGEDGAGGAIAGNGESGEALDAQGGEVFAAEPAALAALAPGGALDQTAMIRHVASLTPAWERLADCVREGSPAIRIARPIPVAPQASPDNGQFHVFMHAMHQMSAPQAEAFVAMPETQGALRLLDVGGGPGSYDVAFVRARGAAARATILDRPGALAVAREIAREAGVKSQIAFRPGDALEDDFGAGAFDLVLMSQILHAFGPNECRQVIAKAAGALAPGGVLAINEFALDDGGARPASAAIFGANMLVGTDRGQTYKASELAGWMSQASLLPIGTRSLGGHSTLVFAKKAPLPV